MKMSRQGVALVEYVLLGSIVFLGAAALLQPYAKDIAALIRGTSPPITSQVYYATPALPTVLPNVGSPGATIAQAGGCNNLTYSYLENTVPTSQYNYIVSAIPQSALNSTENWVGPDGQTYTYPKYVVGTDQNGNSILYAFCGNPGETGYWNGASNKGYRDYYAVGEDFKDLGDGGGAIIETTVLSLSHPYLQPNSSANSGDDGTLEQGHADTTESPITALDFSGSDHCPTFGYFSTPLILDINRDGKISAAAGIGVDIDGNGTPDGAAVNGDKMLAMSPMNKDKVITGREVFGDHTIDPFTGFPLKAANGFIALKKVAISAQKNTGIKCLEGTYVDARKLKAALKKAKKGDLGLISDNNITVLEPLGDVAKINTDYKQVVFNKEDTANVKHRQIGNWLDVKNISHIIHDVWFSLTSGVKKLISSVAKTLHA